MFRGIAVFAASGERKQSQGMSVSLARRVDRQQQFEGGMSLMDQNEQEDKTAEATEAKT